MRAIIAEKPSVASEIARIVGATEKKDGCYEGCGYVVTWALGHLVGLAMPEDYGIKGFCMESLPIIPEDYLLTVRKIRTQKGFTEDPGSVRQLAVIRTIFNQCESIIVATDAGREGEVIFRFIYEYLGCKKPFERLWISSLTEKAIINGLENLRKGSEFDGLYYAGRERSQADWLVGINATQALTVSMGDGLYSLGRVQTPTLSLICKRYNEHKDFKVTNYFQIELEHQREGVNFKSQSVDKWDDQRKAEAIIRAIEREDSVAITDIITKTSSLQAPLLFDLTALQKEANKKLGLSAEKTLQLAQSLYEKKFISYPRTGSKYIPEDVWQEIPDLILALKERHSCREAVEKLRWERYNKHIVSDVKVTDHHGIIVTENIPAVLDAQENVLYDMIALRLLESVSPACQREITDVKMSVLHYDFSLKAIKFILPGWKLISGNFDEEDEDVLFDLPYLEKGERIKKLNVNLLSKKTKPPALYTEADLLTAMEKAGNNIEDQEERKILKSIGLGTPATRAAIIETLMARGYIKRERKSLIPQEKGLMVYNIVKDKRIGNVEMTARWEMAFEKIQNNEADPVEFHRELEILARGITKELLEVNVGTPANSELCCPRCNGKIYIREKVVKCQNEGCDWMIYRTVCGVHLNYKEIESLLTKQRTPLIKNLISRDKKKFNAFIVMTKDGSTSFEFEQKNKGKYK